MECISTELENSQNHTLREIISVLVRLLDPEVIFLLASEFSLTDNIFKAGLLLNNHCKNYELLVLRDGLDVISRDKSGFLGEILSTNGNEVKITVSDLHQFNENLRKGLAYENHIIRNAMTWYHSGRVALADPVI